MNKIGQKWHILVNSQPFCDALQTFVYIVVNAISVETIAI